MQHFYLHITYDWHAITPTKWFLTKMKIERKKRDMEEIFADNIKHLGSNNWYNILLSEDTKTNIS